MAVISSDIKTFHNILYNIMLANSKLIDDQYFVMVVKTKLGALWYNAKHRDRRLKVVICNVHSQHCKLYIV